MSADKQLRCKRYYGAQRKRNVTAYLGADITFTTCGIMAKENGSDRKKHVVLTGAPARVAPRDYR